MVFPHFKHKQLRSINFDLVPCDGLDFYKEIHFMSLRATSSLHTIMYTIKTHGLRAMVWGWQFILYSCILVCSLVTSTKELLYSYVILQVECQKFHSSNHFWNQNASLIFQNSTRGKDFGKSNELHLWDHTRLQKCICEFLKGTHFRIFGCKSKEKTQLKDKLIISLKF